MKQFGHAVRKRREALELSQERLAEIAGIHRNYAGYIERGERNITLIAMLRVASALGVPLSSLLSGIELPPSGQHRTQPTRRSAAK